MFNNKYLTLTEAAEVAAKHCDRWHFFTAKEEQYDPAGLVGIAEVHDSEAGVDEDSFYLVSPGGAIGFSEDGETIDWLFLPINSTEKLPEEVEPEGTVNFCPHCGEPAQPGDSFCGACGKELK